MNKSIDEEHQYLTFVLGQDHYAVSILCIREIIEQGQFTPVPMMPAFLRGVINLRGQVVPVVDLLARFGQGRTHAGKRTCVVILEVESEEGPQQIGVLVDAVNEVIDIPAAAIEPAPAFGARLQSHFIRGMGKVDGRFVVILEINQVLSLPEMAQLASSSQGAQVAEETA